MNIFLNGQQHTVTNPITVAELVANLELTNKRIAVELNRQILSRSLFARTQLQSGDRIEIVHAIGGG